MEKAQLDPYIFFTGNCREAMEFYKTVFGGELTMSTYDEAPGEKPENSAGKVMHSKLTGGLISFMGSDSTRTKPFGESFITLSITGDDEKELRTTFDKLGAGGKVTSALKKEFWGDTFGTLTDKFGVDWMVNINAKQS